MILSNSNYRSSQSKTKTMHQGSKKSQKNKPIHNIVKEDSLIK